MTEIASANPTDILIYNSEDGKTRIDVRLYDENVWLSQNQIAELFQTSKQNVSLHIKNIFDEKELEEKATVKDFLTVQTEGLREVERQISFYNLEIIIAVGYRVKSVRGTQFRRWATERLKEYLVKGFTMDDERLKEGKNFGADYFDELLERIRDIRASEKRFYQKIKDIYALSADYEPNAEATQEFFKIVQNKLHYAISGKTAAEIIADRADAKKPNMGLTSWKDAKVRKSDVTVAKNYLNQEEISNLNLIVNMYLDYAELQARNKKPIYMKDWRDKLDGFLKFNEKDVLANAGRIKMEVAQKLAIQEYDKFNDARIKIEAKQALEEEKKFEETVKQIETLAKTRKPRKKKP